MVKVKIHNHTFDKYLPAVHIWQDECGAHAMPLTQAL